VTKVLKVHPQCIKHGLTVKQLGLLTNRNRIKEQKKGNQLAQFKKEESAGAQRN